MTEPVAVMLDLETLGTEPYAPLLSIGACAFAFDDAPITDMFYQVIDLDSCIALGLKPSGDTIKWWMQQLPEARVVFLDPAAVALPLALDNFTDWLNSRPLQMWANPARFDYGLLSAAYKVCGKTVPWNWFDERCFRTLKKLPVAETLAEAPFGTAHHALDDALRQALHLREIIKALKLHPVPLAPLL